MKRAANSARALTGLLASAALAGVSFGSTGQARPPARLRVAVLPCTNIESSFQKFHPLFEHLESSTGHRLELVVPAELEEFETAARNGQIDFALQDPYTYRQLSHLFDDSSLLQTRGLDGSTRQSAVVVVRKDSGVSQLPELRGREVMFGPRLSSPKWTSARLLFESVGMNIDRDLKVLNGGCCEDIAFTVLIRSADAGVVCDHFLAQHAARQKDLGVDPDQLKVIDRTAPVPTRIFAALRGVPTPVVEAINGALLDLDPRTSSHATILASAELTGFFRTTEADYLQDLPPGGNPPSEEVGSSAPRR